MSNINHKLEIKISGYINADMTVTLIYQPTHAITPAAQDWAAGNI